MFNINKHKMIKLFRSYLLVLLVLLLLSLIIYEIYTSNTIIEPSSRSKKRKIAAAGNLIGTLQVQNARMNQTIRTQAAQMQVLDLENRELNQNLNNAKTDVSTLKENVQERDDVIESNRVAAVRLQGEVSDVKNKNNILEGDLDNTKSKLAFYESAYNSMITGV